jgi:hypothetical protein
VVVLRIGWLIGLRRSKHCNKIITREKTGARAWSNRALGKCYGPASLSHNIDLSSATSNVSENGITLAIYPKYGIW